MFSAWPLSLRALMSLLIVGLYFAPCLLRVSDRPGCVPRLVVPAVHWGAADYWKAVTYTPKKPSPRVAQNGAIAPR
jgi:hypothetical protein